MKQEQPSKGNSTSLNIHHQYLILNEQKIQDLFFFFFLDRQNKQELYLNHA